MPGTQNTFTGHFLFFYGAEILVSLLITGGLLWLTRRIGKRFPPFASVLLAITCLCASALPLALLQIFFPSLDPLLARLTPLLMVATCGLIGTVRFARARYREEVQSLGLLLVVVVILALSVLLGLQVFPLVGAPDVFALGTAGMLLGAIANILHPYLRGFLARLFTRHLPQREPPAQQSSFGSTLRVALSYALLGFGGLAFLWHAGRLDFFVCSLPGAGALCAWILLLDAFVCWLTIPRPLPAYWLTAAEAAPAAHSSDDESSS